MRKIYPFVAIAVVLILAMVNLWPRTAETSDGVMQFSARVEKSRVTLTAKNLSAEPVTVEQCTHHMFLSGGVQEPSYKPCQPKQVTIAPGESITDNIPIVAWLDDKPVKAVLRYENGAGPHTLELPLPKP